MANYITVDFFKERNPNVDVGQFSNVTLSGMITTASVTIDGFLNYSPKDLQVEDIVGEKTDGYVDDELNLVIFSRKRPIVSVSSIKIVKGTDTIILDLQDSANNNKFDLPDPKNRIVYPDREISTTSVSTIGSFSIIRPEQFFTLINYRAGFVTIPADIQDATSLFVKDQVARGMNIAGADSIRQGGISMSFSSSRTGNKSGDSDNVRDAKTLLKRYIRITPL